MTETATDRLRVAVGLHVLGVEIFRQRQRREHPDWSERQIDAAVREWLASEPLSGPPSPPERNRRVRQLIENAAFIAGATSSAS